MAKKHKQESVDTNIESLSKAEAFVTRHNKKIIAGVIVLVVAVGGFLWYKAAQQKKDEAAKVALISLEDKAMNSAATLADFEAYMSEHEGHVVTIASFEAGVCAFEEGNYNKAIKHFSEYQGKDKYYNARAKACIGDCYVALGNYEKAFENYEAAVAINDGIWTPEYAFNAGLIAESLGNKEKALKFYNLIKDEYINTPRGSEINKYISRVEAK
jgi:tetratricopeptide (TPR) repeat protein